MKRILICTMAFALIISIWGCGSSESYREDASAGSEGMINIYYPEGNAVVTDEKQYQIKQPDSISVSVEEVMAALMEKLQNTMTYYTYMLDVDNNVSLEFALLEDVDKEYCLLTDASIASTLFQIEGINGVEIKLSDAEGRDIEDIMYERDSFCFYDYGDSDLNRTRVKIYHVNQEGTGLTASYYQIPAKANTSLQESIVELLASSGYIPEETSVNKVTVSAGVCYIDLSHQFNDGVYSSNGSIPLYSVVNSITSLPDISQVQILIDGEIVSTYRGTSDISSPLSFNEEIIEQ